MDSNNFEQNSGKFNNDLYSQNFEYSQNYQNYQQYEPISINSSQAPIKEEPVKISEFVLILALCSFIPCVGIILLFVYGFSKNEKESKKNFCKAYLIVIGIGILLSLIWIALFMTVISALF